MDALGTRNPTNLFTKKIKHTLHFMNVLPLLGVPVLISEEEEVKSVFTISSSLRCLDLLS